MKRLIVLLTIASLFVACQKMPITKIPSQQFVYEIDLTKYAERGFLISPAPYPGEFSSRSILKYEYYPEAELVTIRKTGRDIKDDVYSGPVTQNKWVVGSFDLDDEIEKIYQICLEMDADALVDFRVRTTNKSYLIKEVITIDGLIIEGFAIKRKK